MRFGQNVLRMIWKEGFVQFSYKAHCFPFLRRISGQCDWRFWELWRSQMRFGLYVLRMIWKERFVQFSWKAHCFPFLERIWGECDDFQNFDPQKCDLPKRAAHDLKRTFCTNFMESALFSRFEKNFRPVWRFWQLWRSKMRFGQNVLRMT